MTKSESWFSFLRKNFILETFKVHPEENPFVYLKSMSDPSLRHKTTLNLKEQYIELFLRTTVF